MKKIVFLLIAMGFTGAATASEPQVAETPTPESSLRQEAEEDPAQTVVLSERITIADSKELDAEVEASSTVMGGEEMQEIVEISRHRGDSLQLFLARPPWHGGPVLFHPGGVVYLETKAARDRRLSARFLVAPAAESDVSQEAENGSQDGDTRP